MEPLTHHQRKLKVPVLFDKSKFMTIEEAAEYLNYSIKTLYKLSSQDPELSEKKIKTYNNRVFFRKTDLERYLLKLYSPKKPEKE